MYVLSASFARDNRWIVTDVSIWCLQVKILIGLDWSDWTRLIWLDSTEKLRRLCPSWNVFQPVPAVISIVNCVAVFFMFEVMIGTCPISSSFFSHSSSSCNVPKHKTNVILMSLSILHPNIWHVLTHHVYMIDVIYGSVFIRLSFWTNEWNLCMCPNPNS